MDETVKRIDNAFISTVNELKFPSPKSNTSLLHAHLAPSMAWEIFISQVSSRHIDIAAKELKAQGKGFYTIGSSGHEGNAVLGQVFQLTDMAFLHYRSGAFFLARSNKSGDKNGIKNLLLSFLCSDKDPICSGRHKVIGSVPLFIPPQTSTIASHLPKALGAAFSISRAKELAIPHPIPDDAVILCSFGDASINHASAQTSFNAASFLSFQNYPLPLIFICEDNEFGISVPTPKHWIQSSMANRPGITYLYCDGLNIADVYEKALEAESIARVQKKPVFLHIKTVRLMGHAGADIETSYRTQAEIESTEADDPLLHSARILIEEGKIDKQNIIDLYEQIRFQIKETLTKLEPIHRLDTIKAIQKSLIPPKKPSSKISPSNKERENFFKENELELQQKKIMSVQINHALTDLMLVYKNIVIFGEDVGKKGGVYNVTHHLQQRFGQRRVFDSPLDETSILGTAIGLSHNGFLPIPEIQFLAYVHNAEDQIRGEAATLSYFSNGQYTNPMVIRIPGLSYQKGFGGHFHNDNSINIFRDIPGLIVACPSNGADAAKILRTLVRLADEEGRVSVFIEPIALYGVKDLHQEGDQLWLYSYPPPEEEIEFGKVSVFGDGPTCIITYGNGYYMARKATKVLQDKYQIEVKVIDLHWLCPLPIHDLITICKTAKNILIVDEGRKTGSISEELMTLLYENLNNSAILHRLTGEDIFIPLGPALNKILPSVESIVNKIKSFIQ